MKKTFRFLLALLIAVFTAGVAFIDPIVAQALSTSLTSINVKLPSSIDISDANGLQIALPTITGSNNGKKIIKLTDPNRIVHTYTLDSDVLDDTTYFATVDAGTIRVASGKLVPGVYSIEYVAEKTESGATYTTTTGKYNVTVKADVFKLYFAHNSIIIPTKTYFDETSTNKSTEIKLPIPQLKDAEGEVLETSPVGLVTDVVVTKAGTSVPVELTAETGTMGKFIPTGTGTYYINYKLKQSGNVVDTFSTTINVKDKSDFDPTNIKLINPSFAFTFPSTADLNTTVELPRVNVVNEENKSSQQVYTKVKIGDGEITTNLKFEASEKKVYTVTYYVEDYFGNKLESFSKSVTVADKSAPDVKAVKDYDTTAEGWKDNIVETSYNIRSTSTKDNIIFPAIYATDKGTPIHSDLTFKRILTRVSDSKTWIIGENVPANESVTFNFPTTDSFEAGEYYVTYQATDKAGNVGKYIENGSEPRMYIYGTAPADSVAPTIGRIVTKGNINPAEKIKIALPAITDYDGSNSSSQRDTRIEKRAYWFYGTKPSNIIEFNNLNKNELKIESNAVELELKNYNNEQNVTVAIVAVDDNGNGDKDINHIAFKTISISNTADDDAPRLTTDISDIAITGDLKQDNTLKISDLKIFDKTDKNLTVGINVYDRNGDVVSVKNGSTSYESNKTDNSEIGTIVTLSGYEFDTSTSGAYSIVVTAVDAGGNLISIGTQVSVARTKLPEIEGVGAKDVTIELGDSITLEEGYVLVDGEIDDTAKVSYRVTSEHTFKQSGYTIIPTEEGDYTVTYTATADGTAAKDVIKTIHVSDTLKPQIVVKDKGGVPARVAKNEIVLLPGFTVVENGGLNTSKDATYVSVKNRFNEVVPVTQNNDGTYSFTPNTDGKHTVVYFATDTTGKKSVEDDSTTSEYQNKFYVYAGDNNDPIIRIKDEASTIKKSVKVGTYTVDKTKITVADINADGEEVDTLQKSNLDIVMTHETNGVVSELEETNDAISFNLTEVGKYTLTMSITDAAGNTGTKTFTITIASEKKSAGISDDVLGVILIVVSLVILGGVILFFVLSDRKKNKKIKR